MEDLLERVLGQFDDETDTESSPNGATVRTTGR
jgi:hypothetical protein